MSRRIPLVLTAASLFASAVTWAAALHAQTMVVTDVNESPGKIFEVREGQLVEHHRRGARYDNWIVPVQNRIASIAIDHYSHYFFCSNLDGCVFEYDGQNDAPLIHDGGAVRHVALDRTRNLLYYSSVDTPIDNSPLADGVIRAVSLTTRRTVSSVPVRQAEVEGPFWGAIAVSNGRLYMATDWTVYVFIRGQWSPVLRTTGAPIRGLAIAPWGQFYYADGTDSIYAFEKDGSTTLVSRLPIMGLMHVGWISDKSPASGSPSDPASSSSPGPAYAAPYLPPAPAPYDPPAAVPPQAAPYLPPAAVFPQPAPYLPPAAVRRSPPSSPLPPLVYSPGTPPSIGVKTGDYAGPQPGVVTVGTPRNCSIQGIVIGLSIFETTLVKVQATSSSGQTYESRVDARGFFMLNRLPDGPYTVSVFSTNGSVQFADNSQSISLRANTSHQMAFHKLGAAGGGSIPGVVTVRARR